MTNTHKSATEVARGWVQVRRLLRKPLSFWLYLLQSWARTYVDRIPANDPVIEFLRQEILRRNRQFQQQLDPIFTPLNSLCPGCTNNCCLMYLSGKSSCIIPFYPEDALMYRGLSQQLAEYFEKMELATLSQRLGRLFRRRDSIASPGDLAYSPCPYLGEGGCILPWGSRPVRCVLWLCNSFAREMSWPEFLQYLQLSSVYLFNLTWFLIKLSRKCDA